MNIELSNDQWKALEDDYAQYVSEEIARLGFVEINLMEELRKEWRSRGELDDRGEPI